MPMIWTPAQLLLLLCVAIVIAFFIASELIESKRVRRPVRILAESEHAASAMRHLPRASREIWRDRHLAESIRKIALD